MLLLSVFTVFNPRSVHALSGGYVILTFDDSKQQLPNDQSVSIMDQYGYPGVAFLIVSWTDASNPVWSHMLQKGWEIGCHTWTHPNLNTLSQSQLNHEIVDAKTWLEQTFGAQVTSFAYPDSAGSDNVLVLNTLQKADYLYARESDWHIYWDGQRSLQVVSYAVDADTYAPVVQSAINAANTYGVSVIMFHGIYPNNDPLSWDTLTPDQFRYCLDQIKKAGLQPTTFKDWDKIKYGGNPVGGGLSDPQPSQQGAISITFDDGYQDQIDYAYPLIQAKGVHATFYLISDCLTGNVPSWMAGADYMNAAEALQLQASGNEIASHSRNHSQFDELNDQQIRDECTESKQTLTSLGLNIENFAYPYGSTNTHIDNIVQQYYRSGRYGVAGEMNLPYTDFKVYAYEDENLLALTNEIDRVCQTNSWTVFLFHHITPTKLGTFYTTTSDFSQFLDYALNKGVTILTVKQALDSDNNGPITPPVTPPVTQVGSSFELSPNPSMDGQTVALSGTLTDSSGNPITSADIQVYINDSYSTTLITNNQGYMSGSQAFSTGTYIIKAVYGGSTTDSSCTYTQMLTVKPSTTTTSTQISFSFNPNPGTSSSTTKLTGALKDNSGAGIANAKLTVTYSIDNGATWTYIWTLTTDLSGNFRKTFTSHTGTYLAKIQFDGNSEYDSTESVATLTVH